MIIILNFLLDILKMPLSGLPGFIKLSAGYSQYVEESSSSKRINEKVRIFDFEFKVFDCLCNNMILVSGYHGHEFENQNRNNI